MKKEDAINKVQEYIQKKEFSWEMIYHIDEEPIENHQFWIFKNFWEPRESLRGNQIFINRTHPKIIVDKEKGTVKELSITEIPKLNIS